MKYKKSKIIGMLIILVVLIGTGVLGIWCLGKSQQTAGDAETDVTNIVEQTEAVMSDSSLMEAGDKAAETEVSNETESAEGSSEVTETEESSETESAEASSEVTETEASSAMESAEGSSEVTETEESSETESTEGSSEVTETEAGSETESTEASSETAGTETGDVASESTPDSAEVSTGHTPTPTPPPANSEFQIVSEKIGLAVDNIEIDLPEVKEKYELLFVSDMHIVNLDEHVAADSVETVRTRQETMFRTSTGMYSADAWLDLSSILDSFSADAVIMGGDMMDFISPTNVQVFAEGLAQIDTPYMYLRADHDLGTWYLGGAMYPDDAMAAQKEICEYQDVFVMEYPEFYLLGWNNSTSQLTDAGMESILSIWNSGKPIVLATHVPINSIVDNSLAEASSNVDPEGRTKLWGEGCLYQPEDNTGTFLEMLYAETSPVKAIFSGHLHFKHTVQLTDETTEYVFAPAFTGNIARITIK